ncbi:hypothetical protein F2Q70_00008188 [Brassica cretica]|uniref:Uncharacterized protein n=1 Tax=Brassica cretica TaxID=69181 RepID=A0A8S9LQL9_BRACR|nr:hypothetical protein F2Q70_00008188 [Brassica cretica]KAF3552298.1 hypothetical protein DY000_02001623 [Brassica cretica]
MMVAREAMEAITEEGYGGYNGGRGGRGGYCRHGCCYRNYRGGARCCSYARVQTQPGH